ncbi:MAG: glycosyltransferase family 39 protein [Anaerolineales bacterium]|nr:glycosyltransferase family 39 protein [Anaerolineales bacterium]
MALLVILLFGAWARLYRLEALPPGLYSDEAWYALDALDVLAGARPIYFPANNGREPLFIYLLSFSIELFGQTPYAVRLPAALLGVLTVLAAYALGRALFGGRVGLWMATLTAGSLWAIALSRIGLRASTLPPLAGFMLAALVAGRRGRRPWLLALSGALCGLCFYTYLAARLIPLPLLALGLFWYVAHGRRTAFPTRELLAFGLPPALVVAPLVLYAVSEPAIYLGRAEQVSIFHRPEGWRALLENVGAVTGAFLWRGDLNARHNLPGRPVFDPLLSAAFWAGVGLAAYRLWRARDTACALALLWTGTMLAPTLFSDKAPHFLRAIGALPMLFAFPALALEFLWRHNRWWTRAAVLGALALSAGLAVRDYFGPYARDPDTGYFFQAAAVTLAEEAQTALAQPETTVYLDSRLWAKFPAVRFLLPKDKAAALRLYGLGEALPPADTPRVVVLADAADPIERVLSALPVNAMLSARPGALYRNDFEMRDPYPLYNVFAAAPRPAPATPAVFGGAVRLEQAQVEPTADGFRVRLVWSATQAVAEELHSFIHLRQGEAILAQADGPLGGVLYPVNRWRAGDWVLAPAELSASRPLPPDARLFVGVYRFPSGERLLLETGEDSLEVSLPGR